MPGFHFRNQCFEGIVTGTARENFVTFWCTQSNKNKERKQSITVGCVAGVTPIHRFCCIKFTRTMPELTYLGSLLMIIR